MYIVIFCSFIAIFFTYLESKGVVKNGMLLGFFILTTLGVIHYNYGNDYMAYFKIYNDITRYTFDLKGILEGDYFKDPGWALLCWIFKPLGGFFMMVAILSVIQNTIVYNSIKKYVDKRWWSLSVLIYACSSSLYLLSFSMLRQSFVIFIFLGLWPLIAKKKWIPSLFILLLSSFIHKSSLILIPFAFLSFLPIINGKVVAISMTFFFLLLWISKSALSNILNFFTTMEEFDGYAETYSDIGESTSFGLGYIILQIPFILSILYLYNDKYNTNMLNRLLVFLSSIYYIVTPFQNLIPIISRIGMYFSVYQVLSIPIIYSNIKQKNISFILLFIYIFMTLYMYITFFLNPLWQPHYSTFKTVFSEIF